MSLNKSQALNVAKQYVLQRNVRAAIDIYREIIEADPTDLIAINTLGDLYASTGLVRDAIAQFSRVADSYIEGGFTRKAIATLKKIIAADPTNTGTAIKLADMYAKAGLPSEARQHYLRIANAYTRNGETLEALRIFSKIGDLDPSNPSTRIKLGELYLCEGMNEQAYEAFVTAARQLTDKGEIRRALNAYNEALSIRPDSAAALAAAHKLATILGVNMDKVRRSSQSAASGDLNDEKPPITTTSDLLRAPAPLDPGTGTDDFFVVQEISMAERLVAIGQVTQAISMLRQVLANKPDNIDVHIKLKDICLRTGLMAEAAQECSELARIHLSRGEDDRARDYSVRANRLIHLIERPSGDLQHSARKPVDDAEHRMNAAPIKLAPPCEPDPETRQITSELDADQAQPSRITLSVVSPAALTHEATTVREQPVPADLQVVYEPPVTIAADLPPVMLPADELTPTIFQAEFDAESSLESVPKQATGLSTGAMALVMPSLSSGTLRVDRNRDRLRAKAIAATVLVLGLVGAVIGGFVYNAHLDTQYETLALAAPALDDPSSPPAPVFEAEPIEENEPIVVDVTPSLQAETPPLRPEKPKPEVIRNEQPAPPQPSSEPPKVATRPSLLPPRITVNTGSQAETENRTPAGLAGDVPVTVTHPAEPPPKVVRRSTGVVSGVAVIKPNPVYPQSAREARQDGVVTVEVSINEQGTVTSARALSGPALLRNAAVSAARGWRFKPSFLGGVPVATTSTITFNFKL